MVLILPAVATKDAFARLARSERWTRPSRCRGQVRPKERLPYADPAVAWAFCRYDLASGPIRVTAPVGRAFASISFHTRRGLVFYALTDKAATHGVIDAVLATPADIQALAAHDDEDDPSRDLRIAAPVPEGYVVMRVFSELPSLYPEAEAQAKHLDCKPEPSPR